MKKLRNYGDGHWRPSSRLFEERSPFDGRIQHRTIDISSVRGERSGHATDHQERWWNHHPRQSPLTGACMFGIGEQFVRSSLDFRTEPQTFAVRVFDQ